MRRGLVAALPRAARAVGGVRPARFDPSKPAPRRRGARLYLVLPLLAVVPTTGVVAWASISAIQMRRDTATEIVVTHTSAIERASDLASSLANAQIVALEVLLSDRNSSERRSSAQLLSSISTRVGLDVVALEASLEGHGERAAIATVSDAWHRFESLVLAGILTSGGAAPASAASRVLATLEPATSATQTIVHDEEALVAGMRANLARRYDERLWLLGVLLLGSVLADGTAAVWLVRSLRRQTGAYRSFAEDLTRGELSKRLSPRGSHDLAQLGHALNELAQQRKAHEEHERQKSAFTESLQQTTSETEARDLLRRYLERALAPSASVVVLARNASGDRLEAVTPVAPESPLLGQLESAAPTSCLAIRSAHTHRDDDAHDALLTCAICTPGSGATTCTPLLIGGEVIGAVLVGREEAFADADEARIQEAVALIAPTLDNLRHLAIAEWRAATDSLTGLPNKRALTDTLRRMVAQSFRSSTPLAALMCDLDHFKDVNDRVGHHRGDDLLAAVGAVFKHILRAADFVCRYGGEEFLVLLPSTGLDGARVIGEKLRAAVSELRIPAIPQAVTLSVGIAVLPDHAVDATSLQQAADRALYGAKRAGRNRVEVFAFDAAHHRQEAMFGESAASLARDAN